MSDEVISDHKPEHRDPNMKVNEGSMLCKHCDGFLCFGEDGLGELMHVRDLATIDSRAVSRIDEIRARLKAATSGPWVWGVGENWVPVQDGQVEEALTEADVSLVTTWEKRDVGYAPEQTFPERVLTVEEITDPNATFIAHAPDDLEWALSRIAELEKALDPFAALPRSKYSDVISSTHRINETDIANAARVLKGDAQ